MAQAEEVRLAMRRKRVRGTYDDTGLARGLMMDLPQVGW
jgi:hypothetical protein